MVPARGYRRLDDPHQLRLPFDKRHASDIIGRMSRKPKQDDSKQSKRFIETAKEVEADDTEKFDCVFKPIVTHKPKQKPSSGSR